MSGAFICDLNGNFVLKLFHMLIWFCDATSAIVWCGISMYLFLNVYICWTCIRGHMLCLAINKMNCKWNWLEMPKKRMEWERLWALNSASRNISCIGAFICKYFDDAFKVHRFEWRVFFVHIEKMCLKINHTFVVSKAVIGNQTWTLVAHFHLPPKNGFMSTIFG